MTTKHKYYYFIEDLDITNDKIPDGVLIRQLYIKNGNYYYTKNMYVSEKKLTEIVNDIISSDKKTDKKELIVSQSQLNQIKNKKIKIEELPRVIINKKSYFTHLLHHKNLNLTKLLKDLNKLFL